MIGTVIIIAFLLFCVGIYTVLSMHTTFSDLSRGFRITEVTNKITQNVYYIIEQQDVLFRRWSPVYNERTREVMKFYTLNEAEIKLRVEVDKLGTKITKKVIKKYGH